MNNRKADYCLPQKRMYNYVKVDSKSPLTSTKDEVQKFAKNQVKGGVRDRGKSRRFYSQSLLLLRQDRLAEVGCQGEDGPSNNGHKFSCSIFR